jgi:hypothetical protein
MSRETLVAVLRDWETTEEYSEDLAHRHFEQTGLRHWTDVYHEAKEIHDEVYAEPIEAGSPLEALLAGVAAQASNGTWLAIASALGWDAHILALALAHWQEPDENGAYETKTLTLDELKALYENELVEWSRTYGNR